jgi:hypothetical protein
MTLNKKQGQTLSKREMVTHRGMDRTQAGGKERRKKRANV